ncbi:MAG: tetratricopeptide repeat protein [Bacteroidetes bacterium]|nr:MAG: tetratricopeptide repeat protein [Bacteroidota bacterium]
MIRKLTYLLLLVLVSSCFVSKKQGGQNAGTEPDKGYISKFYEGLNYKQQGRWDQAIKSFEECLGMRKDDDAVYYALSQIYFVKKDLIKSKEAIRKAIDLDGKNTWYLQEYGFMSFEANDFDEAAKSFKRLVELEPRNVDWLLSYGEALLQKGDASGALKVLDQIENQLGPNPEMSIEKFRLYRQINKDNEAIAVLERALKLYPDDPSLLANMVDFYFEKKQDEMALSYLVRLSESDPSNGNAHMALAQYYDRQGRRELSYMELKKAFVCDDIDKDVKIKIMLSMFESQSKVDPELFDLVDVLIDKYPKEARTYTLKGDFFMKLGDTQRARDYFREALKYDQGRFAIWDQVLLLDYDFRDYKTMYQDAKECLKYFPAVSKVYLLFGIASNQLKRYDESIDALTTGEELAVGDDQMAGEICAHLAEAYFGVKKYPEAKKYYEKAISLDAANILYKNNYAYRLAASKMDLQKAESLIKQVLEQIPEDGNFIDTYGWVLFQQEKYVEARKQFERAQGFKKGSAHITEHLGDALFKTGAVNEAIELWKKAKEMGSENKRLDEKISKQTYYEPEY